MKMKRILSLVIITALIASVFTVFSLNTAAQDVDLGDTGADNTLTITCRRQVLGVVEVGSEFIYQVALDSAGYDVSAGEGQLRYDDSYVKIVEHGEKRSDGSINMNAYSFPTRIRNSNLVTNYFGEKNTAYYNFSKHGGVGTFTDDQHYFKVRMKALKAGTVDIWHYSVKFSSGLFTSLITDDISNKQLDPIPYTIRTVEPAQGYVGDADGDWNLTIMDATYLQRISAGENLTYNEVSADADSDGKVDLLDSLNVLRYHAGKQTKGKVGEWIFASEQ